MGFRGVMEGSSPQNRKPGDLHPPEEYERETDFVIRKIEGTQHNAAAWRARLDEPLRFQFGKSANTTLDKP